MFPKVDTRRDWADELSGLIELFDGLVFWFDPFEVLFVESVHADRHESSYLSPWTVDIGARAYIVSRQCLTKGILQLSHEGEDTRSIECLLIVVAVMLVRNRYIDTASTTLLTPGSITRFISPDLRRVLWRTNDMRIVKALAGKESATTDVRKNVDLRIVSEIVVDALTVGEDLTEEYYHDLITA